MLNNGLKHHGIKGQKWGVRRFQKKDGSLTRAGLKRYNKDASWDGPLPTIGEQAKMKKEDPERYAKYQAYKKANGLDKDMAYKENKKINVKESLDKIDPNKVSDGMTKAKNFYDKVSPFVKNKLEEGDKKQYDNKVQEDLSKLSDDELKKIVNRLNLEERYTQVMNSRYASNGKTKTERLLDVVGTVLTVGTTAATLMVKMQEFKNKQ